MGPPHGCHCNPVLATERHLVITGGAWWTCGIQVALVVLGYLGAALLRRQHRPWLNGVLIYAPALLLSVTVGLYYWQAEAGASSVAGGRRGVLPRAVLPDHRSVGVPAGGR